jgi:hypothetical protein
MPDSHKKVKFLTWPSAVLMKVGELVYSIERSIVAKLQQFNGAGIQKSPIIEFFLALLLQ